MASLQPTRRTISNYCEPDWDCVHLEHKGNHIPLKRLWNQYISIAGDNQRTLSYAAFCRTRTTRSATPHPSRRGTIGLMHWSSL